MKKLKKYVVVWVSMRDEIMSAAVVYAKTKIEAMEKFYEGSMYDNKIIICERLDSLPLPKRFKMIEEFVSVCSYKDFEREAKRS